MAHNLLWRRFWCRLRCRDNGCRDRDRGRAKIIQTRILNLFRSSHGNVPRFRHRRDRFRFRHG